MHPEIADDRWVTQVLPCLFRQRLPTQGADGIADVAEWIVDARVCREVARQE
jgi:hypothetical protein